MKTLITLPTIISLLALIACIACESKSGALVTYKREAAFASAKAEEAWKAEQAVKEKIKLEIERGYDEIIIMHADLSYKSLNDSVVVRVEDNAFFHKRPAPKGMKNTSAFRYYRLF